MSYLTIFDIKNHIELHMLCVIHLEGSNTLVHVVNII